MESAQTSSKAVEVGGGDEETVKPLREAHVRSKRAVSDDEGALWILIRRLFGCTTLLSRDFLLQLFVKLGHKNLVHIIVNYITR